MEKEETNIRIVFEYTETVFEWQKQTNRASLVRRYVTHVKPFIQNEELQVRSGHMSD